MEVFPNQGTQNQESCFLALLPEFGMCYLAVKKSIVSDATSLHRLKQPTT